MNIAKKYIEGLKNAYKEFDFLEEWNHFEDIIHGASMESIHKLKEIFPSVPNSLLELLIFVDGTYHYQYDDETVLFYFLGSDVWEYPYYLLSSNEICKNENRAIEYYSDYSDNVKIDERITDNTKHLKWLHFSDCMNNGGTSQLFIDFTPSKKGIVGQVVRFLHDPDEFKVIADSFDEYLEKLMKSEYNFINEDAV